MKKTILKISIALLFISLLIIGEYFFLRREKTSTEMTLYGNVDVRLVDMSFRVEGKVEKLFFEEGDFVQTGERLAILEKTPYDAQYRQAKADLQARLTELYHAEILFKRRKALIGVGGVSQEDLDNASSRYEQLQAEVERARASLQAAQDLLNYTEIFAPTDGIILTRIREPGSVVTPSEPVYTISIASPVWIRAFATEKELGSIAYGMPAKIYIDTPGAPIYAGKVGFISPIAEFTPKTVETAQLRTDLVYRLRIYAENPDWRLKQGMPVTVTLKMAP